jgi:hypothetical protein
MNRILKCFLILIVFFASGAAVFSQTSGSIPASASNSSDVKADCLGGLVKNITDTLSKPDKDAARAIAKGMLERWYVYLCHFTADSVIRTQLLGKAEQVRLDKQPGAPSTSSGSTSLVSKGSSPSLLGFALEHGGLTQSTSGNTITFRGNVVNSIRALLDTTYLGSYQLGEKDPLVQYLSKLSFGISFDTSSNQPSTAQGFAPGGSNFSGFSAKYELINHRDPRDKRYRPAWNILAGKLGNDIASSFTSLGGAITEAHNGREYGRWEKAKSSAIDSLPENPSKDQVQGVVNDLADMFHQLFWDLPEVKVAIDLLTTRTSTYLKEEDAILSDIRKSNLLTVEYNMSRQLTTNNQDIIATQPSQKIPSLSNINIVFEKGFQGANAPEITLNAGATWFNSTDPTNPMRGRVRNYLISAQLDVPLKEINSLGRPVLSFSGQFLALLEEPLGQKVILNGVTIDRRGNMGVFQAKLSIPVKDSGVKIPISFTYASRTELVKEKDIRGNIGITFDLDSLFSKSK